MANSKTAYEAAGVSIDAGGQAVQLMSEAVRSTYTPDVLAGIGSFGGIYDARRVIDLPAPALVASTDGVGTKTKIATAMGRYDTIGMDIVNHCINDILVQNARPLFFLDYIASDHLDPQMIAAIVSGIAAACRDAGCALLGGETAEMPGVYSPGEFDLVGTIVGMVSQGQILPSPDIAAGDVILGLPSSGPHTNGYSLIRHILMDTPLTNEVDDVGMLGDALLAPHRSYLADIAALQEITTVKGMAHITGGGLIENVPRILPADLDARISRSAWEAPALFQLLQRKGNVDPLEMYRVFNMGIGMVVIIPSADANQALRSDVECTLIGEVAAGSGKVILD